MAFITTTLILFGIVQTAIMLKTLSYIEKIEKVIRDGE